MGELERDGHQVIGCRDGREALSPVAKHWHDIVFLGVVMHAPDGLDACQELKQSPATLVPVVLVRALSAPTHKRHGIDVERMISPSNRSASSRPYGLFVEAHPL